jgi:anti-sigma regulatory factor (Ser/Thr protein kinase)
MPAPSIPGTAPLVDVAVPAVPGAPAVARSALARPARASLGPARVDDVLACVSEAVGNAVRHAYPGADGTVHLRAWAREAGLTVIVEDRGRGPGGPGFAGRIGMTVMRARADAVALDARPGGGTAVRLEFDAPDGARTPRDWATGCSS